MEDLARFITETGTFFKQHLKEISIVLLPLIIPLEIYRFLIEYYGEGYETINLYNSLTFLPEIWAYPIYQCALILFISAKFVKEPLKPSSCYKLALKFWPKLIILYIILFISSVLGFLLLIIPGVILMSRFSFAEFYCIFHRLSPVESLSLSWKSTKGNLWLILKGIVSISIIVYGPLFLLGYALISADLYYPVIYLLKNTIESSASSALFTIFIFHVYISQNTKITESAVEPIENA